MPKEREYVSITQGCLDARDIKFKGIPEGIEICPLCKGNGKWYQHYMEGKFTGACTLCDAKGFVYTATAKPVPVSVTNQIAVASGMTYKRFDIYGLDWKKETS